MAKMGRDDENATKKPIELCERAVHVKSGKTYEELKKEVEHVE